MTQTAIDDLMLDEEWLAAPRPRSRIRIVLVGALAASLCFLGGALVQKQYGASDSQASGPAGFDLSALAGGELPAGFPQGLTGGTGGSPGAGQGSTGGTTTPGGDSKAVIGTVIEVRPDSWIVKDLGGKRHEIKVADGVAVVRESRLTRADVKVGDSVDVSGSNVNGMLQAEKVTLR